MVQHHRSCKNLMTASYIKPHLTPLHRALTAPTSGLRPQVAFGPCLWNDAPAPGAVTILVQWWGEASPGETIALANPAPPRRPPGRHAPSSPFPPSSAVSVAQTLQGRSHSTGSSVRSLEYAVRTGESNFKHYVLDAGPLQLLVSAPDGSATAPSHDSAPGQSGSWPPSPKWGDEGLVASPAVLTAETGTGAMTDGGGAGFRVLSLSPGSPVGDVDGLRAAQGRVIGRVPVDLSPLAEDGRLDGACLNLCLSRNILDVYYLIYFRTASPVALLLHTRDPL